MLFWHGFESVFLSFNSFGFGEFTACALIAILILNLLIAIIVWLDN